MSRSSLAGIAAGTMLVLSTAGHGQSPDAAPAAPKPELTWAFSVDVEVGAPIEQGEIDGGIVRFIPIQGGRIYGPRLQGMVMEGGGDWQTIRKGGLTDVEARYFLRASDGTVIEVHNPGVRVADEETIGKLMRGEPVPQDSYYFRTQPRFRVASGPFDWMARHVFVARGVRYPDRVVVDYYIVE